MQDVTAKALEHRAKVKRVETQLQIEKLRKELEGNVP